ncbi:phosphoethanolamine transferase [Aquimarina litoralis]|uniref:phosphoethanolamine transferase n=1 Tax=Aquimarina litoralis TaxID=584605 RepID=UPI001C569A76|nr:phosphoethanolamine transferase [Aquimarina litoralis]MBW1297561.1 sulfatase-like hydrolase/transferase [Aquimarina litoralis]
MKWKQYKKVIFFHLILNIVFALFITCSSYYNTPLKGGKDVVAYLIHLCIIQSTFAGVLYILSLSKIVFKLLFSLLFLVLGGISFWIYSIDISVSTALIHAILTTKSYIVRDLISVEFILFLFLLAVVLFLVFKFYNKIEKRKGFQFFLPLSIGLICLFFVADKLRLKSFSTKLPYSLFYSTIAYMGEEDIPLKKIEKSSSLFLENDITVVFILGESVRADHLSLNGYKRNTTPKLAKRKNIVSFKNVFTNKTNTALSLPRILTNQSISGVSQDSIISLFDMVNSRNIHTSWIGNQLLESSYKTIVNTNNEVQIIDELRSFWSFHKKEDLCLIPELKKQINKQNNGLFSLHMIGSHWWYEDRYTDEFREFIPVVDSKYIPSLTKEQMINSYDNTILYLDNFLDSIISFLDSRNTPTVMVYISDHGEAMGEDGKWLHSHYKSLTNPAMLVWYSDEFRNRYEEKINSMIERSGESITTDIMYHSILDLFNIEDHESEKSIFFCEN